MLPKGRAVSFLCEKDCGVATVTLNRPERLNALTFQIYRELREKFQELDRDPEVRSILLTGSGRGFCSGGDVEDIIGPLLAMDFPQLLEFTRVTGDLILSMIECRHPIVGALNGTVAGAGAVIAAACDFRLASPKARIAYLFVKVGLSGADMGASWLLPRIVGLGRAAELLMLGDFVSPEEARAMGLYHRVVPEDKLLEEGRAWADRLARGPRLAQEITKKMLIREASMDIRSAMAAETDIQAALMLHPNFKEAYQAFVDKREARFE